LSIIVVDAKPLPLLARVDSALANSRLFTASGQFKAKQTYFVA